MVSWVTTITVSSRESAQRTLALLHFRQFGAAGAGAGWVYRQGSGLQNQPVVGETGVLPGRVPQALTS